MFISFWDFKKLANEKVTCTINGTLASLVYEGENGLRFQKMYDPYSIFSFSSFAISNIFILKNVLIITNQSNCIHILNFN